MVGGLLASEWHGLIACNIIGSLAAGNDHTCNFVHSIVGRAPGVREPRGGMQARHWRSETLGMLSCHTVGPTQVMRPPSGVPATHHHTPDTSMDTVVHRDGQVGVPCEKSPHATVPATLRGRHTDQGRRRGAPRHVTRDRAAVVCTSAPATSGGGGGGGGGGGAGYVASEVAVDDVGAGGGRDPRSGSPPPLDMGVDDDDDLLALRGRDRGDRGSRMKAERRRR